MKYFKIIFLVLIVIFFCGCTKNEPNIKINYIKIDKNKLSDGKLFHGMVKSQLITNLSFQTEGKIIFMPYTKGDFVKKGTVLARLDGILYKIRKEEEQANLDNAIIQFNKSKSYFKRMDILHKEGGISDNDWEDAYFAYKTNLQQIKIQKEKLNYLEKEISYNIITAPYDGFIEDKLGEIGAYAKIGEPVIVLNGNNLSQIEIMVDSSVINSLILDAPIKAIYNNAIYHGKISHISKTSINSGGYLVKINLDKLYSELKDGMNVDVEIPFLKDNFLLLPLYCIREDHGEKFVYKITNIKDNIGTVQKQKIETKNLINEQIQITKGIQDGDYIAADNLDNLKPNQKVKL